jgi:hypothetical protein
MARVKMFRVSYVTSPEPILRTYPVPLSHARQGPVKNTQTLFFESYDELNKYLAAVESPLQMPVLASSAFLETQAVISSLPPSQHNFSNNTSLSHHYHRISTIISQSSSIYLAPHLPPGPLPPPPSTRSVRPRSGSFDDPAYLVARPKPFSKRPRNDHTDYDFRPLPP